MPDREIIEFEIVDSGDFRRFADRMARLAHGELKAKLRDGLAEGISDLPQQIQRSALSLLPRRGGLGSRVARSRYRTRQKNRAGGDPEIEFTATSEYEISYIDEGRVAHPVFDHNTYWPTQRVPPGFFTKPTERADDPARKGLLGAMRAIKRIFDRI